MRRWLARLGALLACTIAGMHGCGGDGAAPPPKDATKACATASLKPDGSCCAHGGVYSDGQCKSVGPPACGGDGADPGACLPRWCAQWQRADGTACSGEDDDCLLVHLACPNASGGCTTGSWPDASGSCRAAGLAAPATPADDDAPLLSPAGVPGLADLPETGMPPLCQSAGGETRWCEPDETPPCGAGKMPDPREPASCIDAIVPWVCPPGFVASAKVDPASDLPGCVADPDDCGDDPFGGVAEGPAVVFVSAAASADGNGSRSKPFATLSAAIEAAPVGGTVAIASGEYAEQVSLTKPLQLIGRCAAMVRVYGGPMKATVKVIGAGGAASEIRGIHIDKAPQAIWLGAPRQLTLRRVWVTGALGAAVAAKGSGAKLQVRETMIDATRAGLGGPGVGLASLEGAHVTATDVRVSHTDSTGVSAVQKPSVLVAERLLVDGMDGPKPSSALLADAGGRFEVRGARIVAASGAGILVRKGGQLTGYGVTVARTQVEPSSQVLGHGVVVSSGGEAELQGARLSANHSAGVGATDDGSRVAAHALIVDGTLPDKASGIYGTGLMLGGGATAQLHNTRITACHDTAMLVTGQGTLLQSDGLLVDHTQPRPLQLVFGQGLVVGNGARAEVRHARFTANYAVGISIIQPGTRLLADDVLVDHTEQQPSNLYGGYGLVVTMGASAWVRASRFTSNQTAGVAIETGGARLDMVGCLIDHTRSEGIEQRYGIGLQTAPGATVNLSGCRLASNRQVGILVRGETTQARVAGCTVEDTQVDVGLNSLGIGIAVVSGVETFDLDGSLIRRNQSAGVYADRAPIRIRNSAIIDTLGASLRRINSAGKYGATVELGDGVVGVQSPLVDIASSLLSGHARAGLLLDRVEQAVVGNSSISNNYFGIVLLSSPAVAEQQLTVWGNTQDRASPAGLFVPPPPTAADTTDPLVP